MINQIKNQTQVYGKIRLNNFANIWMKLDDGFHRARALDFGEAFFANFSRLVRDRVQIFPV